MNLPNKLTILRVILIPFFVVFLLGAETFGPWSVYVALAIFVIASLTDMLDGKIARKYNLVTNFGKFMDPLADKLLVVSALVCYVDMGRIPSWIVLIIIAREFIISGFRLVAAESGIVIAASYWGKIKTAVTDGYDHFYDAKLWRNCCVLDRADPDLCISDSDGRISDRLYCKE